jgi:uncharacterized protein
MRERIAVTVMARAPSDERGKTRLVRSLDIADGAALRRALLLDTLDSIGDDRAFERLVAFTPESAREELATLVPGSVGLLAQRGDDLGARMRYAFDDLFAAGLDGVILIGSDVPTLPGWHVRRAVELLAADRDPLVLGPSDDGGYYLIGLRRPHPELFEGIPWTTPAVFAATCDAAARTGVTVRTVPPWFDVDVPADLRRVLDGHGVDEGGAHTLTWLRQRPELLLP